MIGAKDLGSEPGRNDGSGVSLSLVRRLDGLRALEDAWRGLWAGDPQATPFQHPAWLGPWWEQFGQVDLRVLLIWRAGVLAGLIPMYVLAQPGRERQMLFVGAGTTDYLDGVFGPGCTVADVVAGLGEVFRMPGWDAAFLTQVRAGSLIATALERTLEGSLAGVSGRRYAGEACSRRPAATIDDLPAKVRADVRFFRNAAAGRGRLALRTAHGEDWRLAFDLLVRFHTERWEQAGEAGVLADPAVLAWHREAIPRLEAAGLLRLQTLMLEGEPIAVLYGLVDPPERGERTAYFYLMGYSVEHEGLRPGVLLMAFAIEAAAREGVRTIDMLRGQEAYKQFWRVTQVPTLGFELRRVAGEETWAGEVGR